MEKAHTLGEVWGARWARLRRGPAKREEIHRPGAEREPQAEGVTPRRLEAWPLGAPARLENGASGAHVHTGCQN